MTMAFEVRIPSYRRPQLLARALESLRQQTYRHWRATVFDDSASAENAAIVDGCGDRRLVYVANSATLGAALNIDQSFSPVAFQNGHFGCLLEDDNFWLPDFLSTVATQLKHRDISLVLANQLVSDEGIGIREPAETTRGHWFSPGMITPLELRARLLLMEGLSNGGMVWRLNADTDLRVGDDLQHTGLQEACRSLLVQRPFLFIDSARAVWSAMKKETTARAGESNRLIARGMQSVRTFVLREHAANVVRLAEDVAQRIGMYDQLHQNIAYSGFPQFIGPVPYRFQYRFLKATAKGWAIRRVQRDDCAEFLVRHRSRITLPG